MSGVFWLNKNSGQRKFQVLYTNVTREESQGLVRGIQSKSDGEEPW